MSHIYHFPFLGLIGRISRSFPGTASLFHLQLAFGCNCIALHSPAAASPTYVACQIDHAYHLYHFDACLMVTTCCASVCLSVLKVSCHVQKCPNPDYTTLVHQPCARQFSCKSGCLFAYPACALRPAARDVPSPSVELRAMG